MVNGQCSQLSIVDNSMLKTPVAPKFMCLLDYILVTSSLAPNLSCLLQQWLHLVEMVARKINVL